MKTCVHAVLVRGLLAASLGLLSMGAWALDLSYAQWNSLLKQHVRWLPDNKQSRVDYDGFSRDKARLEMVLNEWSSVTPEQFTAFSRAEQMAFLINAYNGFTIALILTEYPGVKSIKSIGGLLGNPWKKEFFVLLGKKRHLDWIEHDQLRPKYQEPRVHAAVNCASIGCPALRNEAFTAKQLEDQLEDGMRRFVSDSTRNRVKDGTLQVSPIFKWFAKDFEQGHQGFASVKDVFARYAKQMSDAPEVQAQLVSKALPLAYTDYDWALNGLRR